jgi:cyclophilin family peptidyl-prolyl cis-trans isomerase
LVLGEKTLSGTYEYKNCPIHRLVKNGWFQSGDVIDGTGKNSIAVIDESGIVRDESFAADFGFAPGGIVGYANDGPHTNRSQFFVTLAGCSWMNNKFVGVGRVLQGFNVLRVLNGLPTSNQVPSRAVIISDCGLNPTK